MRKCGKASPQQSNSEPHEEIDRAVLSKVMSQMGRKGGKIGGKRRLETLSPERRSEIAKKAAQKRWEKKENR